MRVFLKALLLCGAITLASDARAQGWEGIIPLHSTRADVERLLGPGVGECRCLYGFEGDDVRIDYAKAPCEGDPSGWNVPADTVLVIHVRPGRERQFFELGLDESKYEKDVDDTLTIYYSSREEGVQYTVNSHSGSSDLKDMIDNIKYVPSSGDAHLRCPCFPADDGSIERPHPFDEFADFSFEDARARLDNFAIVLMNEMSSWKGHVIVYAGKGTRPGKAKKYVRDSLKYLMENRGVPPEKISAVYGGYRGLLTVELFLFAPRNTPPRPRPSHVPCDRQPK